MTIRDPDPTDRTDPKPISSPDVQTVKMERLDQKQMVQYGGRLYEIYPAKLQIERITALILSFFQLIGGDFSEFVKSFNAVVSGSITRNIAIDKGENKLTEANKAIPSISNLNDYLVGDVKVTAEAAQKSLQETLMKIVLKHGLIPTMSDPLDKKYLWAPGVAVTRGAEMLPLREVISTYIQDGELTNAIESRQKEIAIQKEAFRSKIEQERQSGFLENVVLQMMSQNGQLEPMNSGQGGSYLLKDSNGQPTVLIKPNDEDTFCLNNPNGLACPLKQIRSRDDIPTYESSVNEALGSDMAQIAGLREIVPVTILTIFKSDKFHIFSDNISERIKRDIPEFQRSESELEKLVSAQEYVPNAQNIDTYLSTNQKKFIDLRFNQRDFEFANIFTWISGDEDAHPGNYLICKEPEKEELRLKKIDNSLICGEGSGRIDNALSSSDQMNVPISDEGRDIINDLRIDEIVERMQFYGKSEASIFVFIDRTMMMQRAIEANPNITLKQMNDLVLKNYAGLPR